MTTQVSPSPRRGEGRALHPVGYVDSTSPRRGEACPCTVQPKIYLKPITTALTHTAAASVLTANASRYLQQLCKHWAHNLQVEFTPEHGRVIFPKGARGANHPADGIVTFDFHAEALKVRIDASSQAQLDGLKGAVERHLDRFAFREAPLTFDWA